MGMQYLAPRPFLNTGMLAGPAVMGSINSFTRCMVIGSVCSGPESESVIDMLRGYKRRHGQVLPLDAAEPQP